MKNIYEFSVIMSYRHSPDRIKPLRRVLDWLDTFKKCQVILVEQDKHSKIKDLNLSCEHIFVKNDQLFNKSWGFNIGLRYAQSDIIVFTDTDILMEQNSLLDGLKMTKTYEVVSPYNKVVDLDPNESRKALNDIYKIDRTGRGEKDIQKINMCGGLVIFRKDAITKIQGWNDIFEGWGAEDDFQSMKVKAFLTYKEMESNCYHLYHIRELKDKNAYKRNLMIFQKYNEMNRITLSKSIRPLSKKNTKLKYDK